MRIPPTALSFCGNGSRVEREVASLEIRVRFPVAAPAECYGDYMVKIERSIGVRIPSGRGSARWSPFILSATFVQRMSWGLHVASSNLVESNLRARSSEVEPSSPQILSLLLPSTLR